MECLGGDTVPEQRLVTQLVTILLLYISLQLRTAPCMSPEHILNIKFIFVIGICHNAPVSTGVNWHYHTGSSSPMKQTSIYTHMYAS